MLHVYMLICIPKPQEVNAHGDMLVLLPGNFIQGSYSFGLLKFHDFPKSMTFSMTFQSFS